MSNLLAYVYVDQCRRIAARSGASPAPQNSGYSEPAVTISSSVGLRSSNIPFDVTKIQNALNRVTPAHGGPAPPLVPDGACGPKTIDAIQKFQLRQFGWSGADGKINPHGETLARINAILARPQEQPPAVLPPDAPEVNRVLDETMRIHLMEARRWVNEARQELMALEPFVDSLDDSSQTFRRLDNVFAIGQNSNRRATVRKILQVYDDMERAFQRHTGTSNPVFELYKGKATGVYTTGAVIAFTTAAGFYSGGFETDSFEFGKTRTDKVYLMPSGMVANANANARFYTSVLIHELAHFVGGWHSVGTIEDWDYKGTPLERLRAANCYQRYAEAVYFQTDGK